MKSRHVVLPLVSTVLALACWSFPRAQSDSLTTIDFPGALDTSVSGLNDDGQIVGSYVGSDSRSHGFLRSGDTFTTIDGPGGQSIGPTAINAFGQIVGSYVGSDFRSHGFLRSEDTFATIDFPGATLTQAWGINDAGQIVGMYVDVASVSHGFLLDGESFTTIDPPGARSTSATGINAAGQIVGRSFVEGSYRAFLLDGGVFTLLIDVDVNGCCLWVGGNNDFGQIVGYYVVSDDFPRHVAFLLDGDTVTTFRFPVYTDTWAYKINNRGQIVGGYQELNYRVHGFLFTPN